MRNFLFKPNVTVRTKEMYEEENNVFCFVHFLLHLWKSPKPSTKVAAFQKRNN